MFTAKEYVEKLALLSHPEGGFYKETYRSAATIDGTIFNATMKGERNISTAIYFLLEQGNFSAFHKIKSDECWHFYAGNTLWVHVINQEGILITIKLGPNINEGEVFQFVVPANCWFASETAPHGKFSLVGCSVAPGFDFADFELAKAAELSRQFPQHKTLIERLCRV
jgi:predicted cupin superfamily sugar epimerase